MHLFEGTNLGTQPGYAYKFFCLKVGYFDFVKNIRLSYQIVQLFRMKYLCSMGAGVLFYLFFLPERRFKIAKQ